MWWYRRALIAVSGYLDQPLPLARLVDAWTLNLSRLLFAGPGSFDVTGPWIGAPVVLLGLLALYHLCRRAPPRPRLFVLLLVVIPVLPFVLADLILGGQRSTQERYLFASFLGLELAVAYLLARAVRTRLGQLLCAGLLVVGAGSSLASVQADTWWGLSQVDLDLVDLLDVPPRPLVVTDLPFGVIAPLSYRLQSDVHFVLTKLPATLTLPPGYDRIYLYQPSNQLRQRIGELPGLDQQLIYQRPREDGTVYSLYQVIRK
jgi:hypothetical protein